jgi:hypothetical protein
VEGGSQPGVPWTFSNRRDAFFGPPRYGDLLVPRCLNRNFNISHRILRLPSAELCVRCTR